MSEILFVVSKGSIRGPNLFNIFVNLLFVVINDENFANYADDNTIYDSGCCIAVEIIIS